jgi:mono/diheme cytochrome c family protein
MTRRARIALFVIMTAALAACGAPATPFPALPPTLVLPTRIAVQPTVDARASVVASPTAQAAAVEPTAAPTRVRPRGTPTITLIPPTPTPLPPSDTPAPTPTKAPDAANGKVLFNSHARGDETLPTCASCHAVTEVAPEEIANLQGPSLWSNPDSPDPIGIRAGKREADKGVSAIQYLRESIIAPNEYLVPNSAIPNKAPYAIGPQSIMFQTYAQVLTEDEINDLVAYLLTIR